MISYVCHWHDKFVLDSCLKRSLKLVGKDELILLDKYEGLSAAYAAGDKRAKNDLVVFVHQDVTFSEGWRDAVIRGAKRIKHWDVLGVYGCRWLYDKDVLVKIEAGGCGQDLGGPWEKRDFPWKADVVDSAVIIKRKGDLKFDPKIPTFHGAAEDICLKADKVYVIGAEVTHHSQRRKSMARLEEELARVARVLVQKWERDIPSVTRIWEHSLAVLQHRSVNEICKDLQAAQA